MKRNFDDIEQIERSYRLVNAPSKYLFAAIMEGVLARAEAQQRVNEALEKISLLAVLVAAFGVVVAVFVR